MVLVRLTMSLPSASMMQMSSLKSGGGSGSVPKFSHTKRMRLPSGENHGL